MQSFSEFADYVQRFKWVAGLIVGAAGLTPVIAAFAGMNPAWPEKIEILTSLLIVVTLILAFVLTSGVRAKRVKRIVLGTALAFVISLFGYLYAFGRFVYEVPGTKSSVTLGCTWKKDALEGAKIFRISAANQCPGDFEDLLANAEYAPSAVWTPESLSTTRLLVLALWLAVFTSLAAFIGAFVSTLKGVPAGEAKAING
jgi:hypothetical protein